MCVHVCSFSSGEVKTWLCLEIPKEIFPGRWTQFSILLSCYHSPGTFLASRPATAVSDKPQVRLRSAHGADTIANRQSGCGHVTQSESLPGRHGPPHARWGVRVQARAFSLTQPQSWSKLARITAKICGGRGNSDVQGPYCRWSFQSQSQSNPWGGPASPVLSSLGASVRDLGCFIFKDKHFSFLPSIVKLCCCSKMYKKLKLP